MALIEICEPMFQYICRLNRSARKGGSLDINVARAEIRSLLETAQTTANATPGLAGQFEKVERPLIFFADSMIYSSSLPWARDWQPLAYEMWGEMAGDEKFFNLLDETLLDASPAATERLEVFYTCIGLGFTGFYAGQPEYLRRKMLELSARLRQKIDLDATTRIIPDDQLHPFLNDIRQPPAGRLMLMGLVLVGLVIALMLSNVLLYNHAQAGLEGDLQTIRDAATANLTTAPGNAPGSTPGSAPGSAP